MKRKRKSDPSVGLFTRSLSPNYRPKEPKPVIKSKDGRRMVNVAPVEHWTGDFLKRKESAWVELECVICRKDFMSRRTAKRVACSRKCVGAISNLAQSYKKKS